MVNKSCYGVFINNNVKGVVNQGGPPIFGMAFRGGARIFGMRKTQNDARVLQTVTKMIVQTIV